jgi:protein-L-isoaspartate(D-aspartate) O-methyltransferase
MIGDDFAIARHNMVEQQIRPWDVVDRKVLQLMSEIPRENFVLEEYRQLAYADTELPIGAGQRMMAPKLEARLLQALNISPNDNILEIGTGSGFLTACLARLGNWVTSIEIHPELSEQAQQRLLGAGISNISLRSGDGLAGPVESGPYEIIAVTGSLPALDENLQQQLAIGGRLFVVTGHAPAMTATLLLRLGEDEWRKEVLFETELAPLEQTGGKGFRF